jgi:RNA polymerase sigma-70 factor, ECF subfamily
MEDRSTDATHVITGLLRKVSEGDKQAEQHLFEEVYGELKRIARIALTAERPNHSLNPTALVNEAFLRFPRQDLAWHDRTHFYSLCARAMRRILVDHARQKAAQKRPNPSQRVEFEKAAIFLTGANKNPHEYLAIDSALDELSRIDPKLTEIVELRFFGGMTEEEVGEFLKCSGRTVRRDWEVARLWLKQLMGRP